MIRQLIICVLFMAVTVGANLAQETEILVLDQTKNITVFNESGKQLRKYRLAGPDKKYIDMICREYDQSIAGEEILVLREDNALDVFPQMTKSKIAKRIKYVSVQPYAQRKAVSIANSLDSSVLFLQTPDIKDGKAGSQYFYTYPFAADNDKLLRSGYCPLLSKHLPLKKFCSYNTETTVTIYSVSDDNYLESFIYEKGSKVAKRVGEAIKINSPAAVVDVFMLVDKLGVLTADNKVFVYTKELVKDGEIVLSGVEYAVAAAAVSADKKKVTETPAKQINWIKSVADNDYIAELSALNLSGSKTINFSLEGRVVTAVEVKDNSSLDLNIKLPADTVGVGVWIKASHNARASFSIVDGENYLDLKAIGIDSVSPVESNRFHPEGMYGEWVLWKIYWDKTSSDAVLRKITLKGNSGGKVLIGAIVADTANRRPYLSSNFWKLKNWDPTKPSSIGWTATKDFEYGYDKQAFLRPVLWYDSRMAGVYVEITAADQKPLAAYKISGDELKTRLVLPYYPVGSYFINITSFNHAGSMLKQDRLVYQVLDTDKKVFAPEDLSQQLCRLSGINYGKATAKTNEKFSVSFDLKNLPDASSINWSLDDTEGMLIENGTISNLNETKASLSLQLSRPGGYWLTGSIKNPQGQVIYQSRTIIGIEGNSPVPHDKLTINENGQPIMLSSMGMHFDYLQSYRLPQYSAFALVNNSHKGGNSLMVPMSWTQIEPVRGCINYHLFERVLDMSYSAGLPVYLGISFASDGIPEWLWFEELISQNKKTIHLNYHYVSPMGKNFTKAHREIYRRLFTHYKNDKRIGGWFYYPGPSEGFLTDTAPYICGYSPYAVERFQDWLKKKYKQPEQLNAIWKEKHATFSEVKPPFPQWDKNREDTRAWWDFINFKQDFVIERMNELQTMLREIDPSRPVLMYAKEGFGATGCLAPIFHKNKIRYSNGGGETFMAYVQSCIMQNHGVYVTCEGHYVMPNSGSVNLVLVNSLLSGKFGGNNIMWGLVWAKLAHDNMPEPNEIFRTTAKVKELLPLLESAKPGWPLWSGYYSATTSLLKKRSFRLSENDSMKSFDAVARRTLHLPESWVDDYSELAALKKYPLLVDTNSEVLEEKAIDTIMRYVEDGGVFVASTHTGMFRPDSTKQLDQLMNRLGAKSVKTSGEFEVKTAKHQLTLQKPCLVTWDAPVEIIDNDDKGNAVLWQFKKGKGLFIISSGQIDFSTANDWLDKLVRNHSGNPELEIKTSALTFSGLLKCSDGWLIPVCGQMPNGSRNATMGQMSSAPKIMVEISSKNLDSYKISELMNEQPLTMASGKVSFNAEPGRLYLVRLQKQK